MNLLRLLLVAILSTLLTGQIAQSHALEPGYLEIEELGNDLQRVFWRKPAVNQAPMDIHVRLPERCTNPTAPTPRFDGLAWVASWNTQCPGGLAGQIITIDGLSKTSTDVLVRYQSGDGQDATIRLTANTPSFVVPEKTTTLQVLWGYIGLGVEHILEGYDHLLFVFAMLLLIRDKWRLFGAVTAFTLAHSLTLAAVSLGWLSLPSRPVEAVIALSIVFLAVELCKHKPDQPRLSERWPWIVSFSFGLLHGFGFAGALTEIGLPTNDLSVALLGFNIGVEIGQLLFIFATLTVWYALSQLRLASRYSSQDRGRQSTLRFGYGIGAVSTFWVVERIAGFAL
ncbi:HupE/UreJ family protein [Parasedimentitalea maritima]|uniref:HupE/UreJ family protein n=1 Tax=Parasedimentitalea maritima TaxID=2578117 RepID=A0A6A4RI01_9RHOB|nr:HupE/UreJ family protein [Zongyanglinia marina]KAE9628895.1 HupE/UreJ family protein [Zongyanglinia marina]